MRCVVRIGEDIRKNGVKTTQRTDKDGNIYQYKDMNGIIELKEHEIISIDIDTENIARTNATLTEEQWKKSGVSGAKEEKKFKIRIVGRIIPSVNATTKVAMFTNRAIELGVVPKNPENLEELRKSVKENLKFDDLIGGLGFGLGVLDTANNWTKVTGEHSLEACNKLKEWALKYKEKIEEEDENNLEKEKEKYEDYRDVKIEIILSDIQSLYYEFLNMYVDYYKENFNIKSGEGTFTLELKQKYTEKAENINIEYVPSWSCFDKITNSIRKILNDDKEESRGESDVQEDQGDKI